MRATVLTTFSGSRVDYLKPGRVNLKDIALGLSRMPRYAGQTTRFYSVAQHSLLVAELVPQCRSYALIHDAQEAFMCDLPTPLKEALRVLGSTAYDELEDRLYAAICKTVALDPEQLVSVKLADVDARAIETRILHPNATWARAGRKLPKAVVDRILNLPDGGRAEWLEAVLECKAKNEESDQRTEQRIRAYA